MPIILIYSILGFLIGFFTAVFLRKIRKRADRNRILRRLKECREDLNSRGVDFSGSQIESQDDPFRESEDFEWNISDPFNGWEFNPEYIAKLCDELKETEKQR